MLMKYKVGVDIGGSHITCGLLENETFLESSVTRFNCDSRSSAHTILETWKECILECMKSQSVDRIDAIGVAMPGPFMYEQGISSLIGLDKFDSLFGVNVRHYFCNTFNLTPLSVRFLNDAASFALGEYYYGAGRGHQKGIYLTIGTGFGSTFLDDGCVVSAGDRVPQYGWLYHVAYKDGIAEEYFSDKWILKRYNELSERTYDSLHHIPTDDESIRIVFEEFSNNLASFIEPWIQKFDASCLIIGGGIVQHKSELILPLLKRNLPTIDVSASKLFENAAILGASACFKNEIEVKNEQKFRETSQPLIPLLKPKLESEAYDMYPVFDCGSGKIWTGYDSLVDVIRKEKRVILDGYTGVCFDQVREEIDKRLKNVKVLWLESVVALRQQNEIDDLLEPYLGGDDPLFGKRCDLDLRQFYNKHLLSSLKADSEFDLNIVIGIGSSLVTGWNAPVIYFDVAKNEIQYRSRAKSVRNFTCDRILNNKEAYKRYYFIEWPILNAYKNEIKNVIKVFVDDQRYKSPVWMHGDDLRDALLSLSESVIRVRPWFEPGTWGGSWMKQNIPAIEQNVVNYAWSFELIAPENGILLSSDDFILEVPFDLFMYCRHKSILGQAGAEKFGYEFPIRFDFLDTFDGGNLSIQCHPGSEYMKRKFGENLAQDETYYILDTKESAKVYLGFQEGVNRDEFRAEVENSFKTSTKLEIEKYVRSLPSHKHDFFLIPHGTIHGSGRNNLVLEISSTPYIFTFKIYDWIRPDLDGKPRTLNIERAFDNLDFSRQGEIIEEELISEPKLIESGPDWRLFHLTTHKTHFYNVHRIEFQNEVSIETNDQFHILMLVEGECIRVRTKNGFTKILHFAETFIIPAAAQHYTARNLSGKECQLVKAFLKKENPLKSALSTSNHLFYSFS